MAYNTITILPEGINLSVPSGTPFLEAVKDSGILINLPCGGEGRCAGCPVSVINGARPPTPDEEALISKEKIDAGVRLACRLVVSGDMTIYIPAASRVAGTGAGWEEVRVLTDGPISSESLALAVDLGTTSIAAALVDRGRRETLAHASMLNPQAAFGADVISRISAVIKDPGALARQQALVTGAVADLTDKLTRRLGLSPVNIQEITIAGNPTMEHLFLGMDPGPIAHVPFTPAFFAAQRVRASALNITIDPSGNVWVFPILSGYVGGDTLGFIWSARMHESDEMLLGIDIGTNGEIVLANKRRILACSTAAGPAFEGSHIKDGMRADLGAIESVVIEKDTVSISVKGGGTPVGICGSGLFDAVSEMRRNGIIDSAGRIQPSVPSSPLSERIVRTQKSTRFILASDGGEAKGITQKDIREIQLAKGAMHAGARTLLSRMGIGWDDIDRVLVAGAFGNYLKPESIVGVGLLPPSLLKRISFVGDAALSGSIEAAWSDEVKQDIDELAKRIDYVELSSDRLFNDLFISSLSFEESSI